MPSTKAIRKRIHSVKNTQKITKAMKMVAAAKLRRAQNQILAFRPYAKGLDKTVFDLMSHIGVDSLSDAFQAETPRLESAFLLRRLSWFFQPREERKIRLLLVTSDRGLCGGFNSSVFRRAEQFLIEKEHCHIEVDIVGKKGRDYVRRRMREIPVSLSVKNRWHSHEVHAEYLGVDSKNAFQYAKTIAQSMQEARDGGAVDAVYVIYNQFHSAAKQTVTVQKLLPFDGALDASPQGTLDYLYEPFKEDVFEHLLPLYFEAEIYRILLDSIASQFGAQMSAMDNASRNAKEMISRLTLQMNRARQAAITKELMEIIGGAEALKG